MAQKEWPDDSKAYGPEEIRWLHEWGLDYKIEENLRRFDQAHLHDEGIPPDVKQALRAAGIKPPPPPAGPTYVDGSPLAPPVQVASVDTDPADDDDPNDDDGEQNDADNDAGDDDDSDVVFDEEAVAAELDTWHVPELDVELDARGLSKDGNKADKVKRIVENIRSAHEAKSQE